MVGRPREFDEDQVLDAAMKAFWANGYEATSLSDLVSATGLHKGSLYQAFGDKHALFLQTLNRYLFNVRQHKKHILSDAPDPLTGIRNVLHGFIDMNEGVVDCPHGCMAVKTMVELAPHDEAVERIMAEHQAGMLQTMQERLDDAQADGSLDADKSPAEIAYLLMIFMNGLASLSGGPMQLEQAHTMLDAQLDALL